MSLDLLTDNWIFTQVGHAFNKGLSEESGTAFRIDLKRGTHARVDVPIAGIQIEALLSLLVNITLRDRLIVDAQYVHDWEEYAHFYKAIRSRGLLVQRHFVGLDNDFAQHKALITSELCMTPSLLKQQKLYEKDMLLYGRTSDRHFDSHVRGTAAMLGRGSIAELHYHPHPLRQRVLEQTVFAPQRRDVIKEYNEHIDNARLQLFAGRSRTGKWTQAQLVLPPIAIDVIEASSRFEDLVSTAVQLRDKYSAIREWLADIQRGIDNEDPKAEARFKRTLSAISHDLDKSISHSEGGDISLELGYGTPSLSVPLIKTDKIKKHIGLRATLNKQVYSKRGERSLMKLLKMFQGPNTKLGREVRAHLQQRFTIVQ